MFNVINSQLSAPGLKKSQHVHSSRFTYPAVGTTRDETVQQTYFPMFCLGVSNLWVRSKCTRSLDSLFFFILYVRSLIHLSNHTRISFGLLRIPTDRIRKQPKEN